MTEQNPNPILVAVGPDPVGAALAFAAAEADRESCGLHLLHVVHLLAHGPETSPTEELELERLGRQHLTAALEQARDLVSEGTLVTADLVLGGVVPSIVEAAADDVRMVVLQHRDLSRVRWVVTRSVTGGVAARARVPVVAVPATWSAEHTGTRTVTVGVDVPDRSGEVLSAAADAAAARSASLRVVHVWDYPASYDDVVRTATDAPEWQSRATTEVQRALDPLHEHLDGVPVQIDVGRAHAADALIEASAHSDLVVIGRHDPVIPLGSHLGPVARAVLREATCPVLLADPHPTRRRSSGAAAASAEARG